MNVQQKVAWFNLTVFAAAAATYVALVLLWGPLPAFAAFGIFGLWGLTPFFYYLRRKGKVLVDERDQLVNLRAVLASYSIFWLCFVAACMITWSVLRYYKYQNTVSVDVLPLLVGGGMIVFMVSHSVAVLIQYGRSRERENK
jgi:hypothetical protein